MKAVDENPDKYSASKKVSLMVTIILPRTQLPVRIRNVPFSVMDQELEETIIDRPFLKCIGFDLERHLERVGMY